jgi:hypothetical protein
MPAEASAEMAATAHGVTATSEMAAAAAGSVPAASAASTAAAMLRPGQSRRSCNRHAQQQGADGSHYISHAHVGHNSSPLSSATSHFSGRRRACRLDAWPPSPFKLASIKTQSFRQC